MASQISVAHAEGTSAGADALSGTPNCGRSMGPQQIHGFRFVPSVDMTEVTKRDVHLRPGLPPNARNEVYEWLPSPATSCHQIEYSGGLGRS